MGPQFSGPGAAGVSATQAAIAAGYAAQATWYIDPANVTGLASDSNTGLTSSTPLLTFGARAQRINRLPVAGSTIYLLSSQTTQADPFAGDLWVNDAGLLTGDLGKTTLHASTGATGITAQSGNTWWEITDTSVSSWTTYLFQRIRWTAGAAAGCTSFVVADLGSHVARITAPTLLSNTLPTSSSPWVPTPTYATPATGDAYVIESLPQIAAATFDTLAIGPGISAVDLGLLVASISFSSMGASFFNNAMLGNPQSYPGVAFSGCNLDYMTGAYIAFGCLSGPFDPLGGSAMYLYGCGIVGGPDVGTGAYLDLNNTVVECTAAGAWANAAGAVVLPGGWLDMDGVGIYDATGPGLTVQYGGNADVDAGGLAGSGNSTYGANVQLGGQMQLNATPTITGTSGNLLDGAVARAWASIGATLVGPRPWSASGSFTLQGATVVNVTVAGMVATDSVSVTCTASGGTRSLAPIIVRTAGGFSFQGVALDTSTYAYSVTRV
jgi:hypothetical protein